MAFSRISLRLIFGVMPLFLFSGCGDLEPEMQDTRSVVLKMNFNQRSSSRNSSVSQAEVSSHKTHLILALPSWENLSSNYKNYYSSFAQELMNPLDNKVSLKIPLNTQMKIFAFLFREDYTKPQLLSGVREVGYYGESQPFTINAQTNNLSLGITLQSAGTTDGDDDEEDSTGGGNQGGNDSTADTTAPTVSLIPATITSSGFAVVQSTETGKAYLVNTDITVNNLASIFGAADNMSNSVAINSANTNTNIQATGLVDGTYKAYSEDAAGNLSDASLDNVTIGGLVDIDGNVYRTVVIGTQHWMAENLKVKKYRDGVNITHITNNSTWASDTNGAYGYYNNATVNRDTYGMLYNGYAADNNNGRKICPQGWHVPSKTEFNTLKTQLVQSGDSNFVLKLREEGTDHWSSDPHNASNSSGFTAIGSGFLSDSGNYFQLTTYAYWWTCCNNSNQQEYVAILNSGTTSYVINQVSKKYGFAVRCLKDN